MDKTFPHNFCNLKRKFSDYKRSRIAILPVPFDMTSSWIKCSAGGPKAIICASKNLEMYDIETDSEVYREGIHTLKAITAINSEEIIDRIYRRVKRLLNDRKFVVLLGGEHTVSVGSIKAYAGRYPNLSILHLDAHTDKRDSYEGNRYSHACVMARVKEILGARGKGQGAKKESIVSVGIRSMDSSELPYINKKKIFYASDIKKNKGWIESVIKRLSDNVYVTIDVDVFDPSIIPSTGTPEPGGLDWYKVMGLLRMLSLKKRVVGFDVVELCPSENRAPDFLVAKLVYTFLSYIFKQR